MPTSPWPLQVFFDGACPICSCEKRFLSKRDRHQRIQWVDIAGPGFDAPALGLDQRRLNEKMHVRDALGNIYVGVDAFLQVARALPPSLLTWTFRILLKTPGMMWLARIFYVLFARNRYRLTGRCTSETCPTR